MGRRPIKKPEVPDVPSEGEDGYMGSLMTVREDDEELLYAGTNSKAKKYDFSKTDEPQTSDGE